MGALSLFPGKSGMASRSTSTGCVVGPIGRLVVAFPDQHRVCDLGLGGRVVVQHVLDRLPSSGEGDDTFIAGGALVPQLHKPAADVPVLVQDRFRGAGLGAVVVVARTDQSAGRAVSLLANGRPGTNVTTDRLRSKPSTVTRYYHHCPRHVQLGARPLPPESGHHRHDDHGQNGEFWLARRVGAPPVSKGSGPVSGNGP
jgi:hypothetical protein